ncbi:hypothetical protein [Kitasatospora sp. DSM 101779]|uniref:hypothetical protein n=1 Tax=Kitasatospora sp. DSM 101779 TaxID=2853165 RepID=UPI0021D806D5|nr:hypothetical protein [Kitasatospora sp. DSM 101779]MCU7820832.1 hypothetical protein [Kitasatospora sp. DSM 101779]
MDGVEQALTEAMGIDGALGAAIVDGDSGMALGTRTGGALGIDPALAAACHTDVVRAARRALDDTGLGRERVEDILTSLSGQYHLIRPLTRTGSVLFLSLVLDRTRANLAMARHRLRLIDDRVVL